MLQQITPKHFLLGGPFSSNPPHLFLPAVSTSHSAPPAPWPSGLSPTACAPTSPPTLSMRLCGGAAHFRGFTATLLLPSRPSRAALHRNAEDLGQVLVCQPAKGDTTIHNNSCKRSLRTNCTRSLVCICGFPLPPDALNLFSNDRPHPCPGTSPMQFNVCLNGRSRHTFKVSLRRWTT